MKLYYSKTSPFARKVILTASELGLEKRIELIVTDVFGDTTAYKSKNPLIKIPAFELDSGEMLVNSPFICQYLASLKSGNSVFPQGPELWTALNIQAVADGGTDAAVLRRVETAMRSPDKFDKKFDSRQKEKVTNAFEYLEKNLFKLSTSTLGIAEMSTICFVDYVNFRFAQEKWDNQFPRLFAWVKTWSERNKMVKETCPA